MRKQYTVNTLREINVGYDRQHRVTESDVEMANKYVELIESSRTDSRPQVGDIVEYTDEWGNYYRNAHIENVGNNLYICERPYTPFLFRDGRSLATSTSGGMWAHIPSDLKLIGQREKLFCDWGHCGGCANGAVEFRAKVNVWEYVDGEHEFTTKDYDKWYTSIREPSQMHPYAYYIEEAGASMSGCKFAFRTEEEYMAWLKTFMGVERGKNKAIVPETIVWTYKQVEACVPLEEYQAIEGAVIDSTLCNGQVQECKRVYEGTKVTTYLPWQNDMIKMPEGTPVYMIARSV